MIGPKIGQALAVIVLACGLSATAASAAGLQPLNIPAVGLRPAIKGVIWTPCAAPPVPIQMGPFVINAKGDCPIVGTQLPLIVISHGRGGTFLGHSDTAQALADAGFIVATISHPGDNALDLSRSNEIDPFIERPEDIRRVLDHMLGGWQQSAAIDARRIGFFGFSRGGYTGLVLAGAQPRFDPNIGLCAGRTSAACDDVRAGRPTPPMQDSRIRAAVIADPLSIFFDERSFDGVRIPIELWRSEHGGDGVTPDSVAMVAAALPIRPSFHTVDGAAHFAFLPPCPPAFAASLPELCKDAGGFDRAAFHQQFNASVVEFFQRTLDAD